jgi:CRP/FNR family transcriptional regulator/CRP/FNR family cyclic AMP-dependent transcriptional regulator
MDRQERLEEEERGLFPWLPAHRILSIERQEQAETLLAGIPLFNTVPPYGLRVVAQRVRPCRFSAGEAVFRIGEMGSTLHVIQSGRMYVLGDARGGEAVVLASLGPGEFFGELALFDRQPRSATVVAAEETETLALGRFEILDIIGRYPEVALAFLSSMSERLRTADNLLENLVRRIDEAEGRSKRG